MTVVWIILCAVGTVVLAVLGLVLLMEKLFPDSIERYASGKIKARGQHYHGDKQGLWMFWYESGQLEARGGFVAGFESGTWSFWHPNGQRRAHGEIDDRGYKKGQWEYWDESGQVLTEAEFQARFREDRLIRWPPRQGKTEIRENAAPGTFSPVD